jgi:hypothetical protein
MQRNLETGVIYMKHNLETGVSYMQHNLETGVIIIKCNLETGVSYMQRDARFRETSYRCIQVNWRPSSITEQTAVVGTTRPLLGSR